MKVLQKLVKRATVALAVVLASAGLIIFFSGTKSISTHEQHLALDASSNRSRVTKLYFVQGTSSSEFLRRRHKVRDACLPGNHLQDLPSDVQHVLTHGDSGVIYCIVPKAGCTFWKRVFSFLNDKNITRPLDTIFSIPRLLVHQQGQGEPFQHYIHNPHKYLTRVMVSRDPLARILSSYLDKFYLPDFWESYGTTFMEQVTGFARMNSMREPVRTGMDFSHAKLSNSCSWIRNKLNSSVSVPNAKQINDNTVTADDFMRKHFDDMANRFWPKHGTGSFQTGSSTYQDTRCGKYLTFSEFVLASMYEEEPHWQPTYQVCNPCQFEPTHVSYMETFNADAKVVLGSMGLKDLVDQLDPVSQVNEEISMLVEYHFNNVFNGPGSHFYSTCLTPQELSYRLWSTFLWQGYIHPLAVYDVPDFHDVSSVKEDLLAQIRQARYLGLKDEHVMEKAKRLFSRKFFTTLTAEALKELFIKFRVDLKLFHRDKDIDGFNCLFSI
ncbi:unnamed protein product [Lymnaea stagnalis]|uniref:Carbohydrate sulfotransferase n=1 Tax=Lymnaea stagnalis TaxID=6523 RepID=A0AAV2HN59_LYMST